MARRGEKYRPERPVVWGSRLPPFSMALDGRPTVIYPKRRWFWICTCGKRGGTTDWAMTLANLSRHRRKHCRDNPKRQL